MMKNAYRIFFIILQKLNCKFIKDLIIIPNSSDVLYLKKRKCRSILNSLAKEWFSWTERRYHRCKTAINQWDLRNRKVSLWQKPESLEPIIGLQNGKQTWTNYIHARKLLSKIYKELNNLYIKKKATKTKTL